jgi:hypothetical protein
VSFRRPPPGNVQFQISPSVEEVNDTSVLKAGTKELGADLHCGQCVLFGSVYWFFFFAFAHLAWAARRIFSLRSSAVIFFAVALPPLLPRATAIGFFRTIDAIYTTELRSFMHSGV